MLRSFVGTGGYGEVSSYRVWDRGLGVVELAGSVRARSLFFSEFGYLVPADGVVGAALLVGAIHLSGQRNVPERYSLLWIHLECATRFIGSHEKC